MKVASYIYTTFHGLAYTTFLSKNFLSHVTGGTQCCVGDIKIGSNKKGGKIEKGEKEKN